MASVPRSGSTWISTLINARNEYRIIFEPFMPARVPLCRHFSVRQYLRPDNDDERFLGPARRIVTGRFRNTWADSQTKIISCPRRLIKDVRTNLMLGWLKRHFPPMRLVLLLRHPCAVAHSKTKTRGWPDRIDLMLEQDDLVSDHLQPYEDVMRSATDPFDKQIMAWCVENLVPLRQLRAGDVHVVFYERVCRSPQQEIHDLFGYLNIPFDDHVLVDMARPSVTSHPDSAVHRQVDLVEQWRDGVTDAQVDRALEILRLFGLHEIYNDASDPNPAAAAAILASN